MPGVEGAEPPAVWYKNNQPDHLACLLQDVYKCCADHSTAGHSEYFRKMAVCLCNESEVDAFRRAAGSLHQAFCEQIQTHLTLLETAARQAQRPEAPQADRQLEAAQQTVNELMTTVRARVGELSELRARTGELKARLPSNSERLLASVLAHPGHAEALSQRASAIHTCGELLRDMKRESERPVRPSRHQGSLLRYQADLIDKAYGV